MIENKISLLFCYANVIKFYSFCKEQPLPATVYV